MIILTAGLSMRSQAALVTTSWVFVAFDTGGEFLLSI
jgi:hypothetical protein